MEEKEGSHKVGSLENLSKECKRKMQFGQLNKSKGEQYNLSPSVRHLFSTSVPFNCFLFLMVYVLVFPVGIGVVFLLVRWNGVILLLGVRRFLRLGGRWGCRSVWVLVLCIFVFRGPFGAGRGRCFLGGVCCLCIAGCPSSIIFEFVSASRPYLPLVGAFSGSLSSRCLFQTTRVIVRSCSPCRGF